MGKQGRAIAIAFKISSLIGSKVSPDNLTNQKLSSSNAPRQIKFGTFPSVRLIEVCKNCAMFVNDLNFQRLLCTVIKIHVVKEAKEAVLYFEQDFRSNLQFIDTQMY